MHDSATDDLEAWSRTIKTHNYLVDCMPTPLDNSANDVNLNCT
jgi:hypothetical protein